MSQLNLLSVEVANSPGVKGSSAADPKSMKTTETDFSDVIEQHYQEQKSESSNEKTKQSGNNDLKAASEVKDNLVSTEVIKEASSQDIIENKEPVQKKKLAEEHILPVPIVVELESAVKNSAVSDDADVFPTSISALTTKLSNSGEKGQNATYAKSSSVGTEATVIAANTHQEITESQQASKVKDNDETVDLLKMLNGAQKLLSTSDVKNKNTLDENDFSKKNNENITPAQKINNKIERNTNLQSQDVGAKSSIQSDVKSVTQTQQLPSTNISVDKNAAASNDASENQVVDDKNTLLDKVLSVAQIEKKDLDQREALSQVNLKPTVSDETIIDYNAEEISTTTETLSSKVATVTPLSENDKKIALEDKKRTGVATDNEEQAAIQLHNRASEVNASTKVEFADDIAQVRMINQNTASVVTATDAKKQAPLSTLGEPNKESADDEAQVNEEISLTKTSNEKTAVASDKVVSMINQTIEAQALRPVASSSEMAIQQEQHFESTMSRLNTSAVQTQKSITALNTETISIYRKDFADAVKDKVMVMINQKIQQVDIQLDPPEMGNVHVRVNLQNEQAAVQFIVQNQSAKEALEQNMTKLREMLAEHGVDVGDANIEQRQSGEQSAMASNEQSDSKQTTDQDEQDLMENSALSANMVKASSTGVDYYA